MEQYYKPHPYYNYIVCTVTIPVAALRMVLIRVTPFCLISKGNLSHLY